MGKKRKTPTKRPPVASPSVDRRPTLKPEAISHKDASLEAPAISNTMNTEVVTVNKSGNDVATDVHLRSEVSQEAPRRSPSPTGQVNRSPVCTQNTSPVFGSDIPGVALANTTSIQIPLLNDDDAFPALRSNVSTPIVTASQAAPIHAVQEAPPAAEPGQKTESRNLSWADCVTGISRSLKKRNDGFILDTGEACVTIPNVVISRNKKSWASFILGQFHGTLPSMGALHAILNGIWSKKARDISISRAGSQSVLIKVPNAATRKRILNQGIWHIEGQSMFVGAWEPGLKAEIPELKEAPVWVDFKGVPPHFFSAEGMEYIASLVGEPLHLHPRTAGMINLEVARVLTLVDLKKSLPDAVYVMFESGERHKIDVSCQWLPPLCTHCNQHGHSLRRCPTAPITCATCKSTTHDSSECNRSKTNVRVRTGQRSTTNTLRQPVRHSQESERSDPVVAQSVPPQPREESLSVQSGSSERRIAATGSADNRNFVVVPTQAENIVGNAPTNNVQTEPSHFQLVDEVQNVQPQTAVPTKTSNPKDKGKLKVIAPEAPSSEEDSDAEYDDGIPMAVNNLPASIMQHSQRQGKDTKGRGQQKTIAPEDFFPEVDSFLDPDDDDDFHTVLKNLPASIMKQSRRQGKKTKGRF